MPLLQPKLSPPSKAPTPPQESPSSRSISPTMQASSRSRPKSSVRATLDVLLLNAGIGSLRWETVSSGHEKTIQVNLLSHALLAFELLPLLKRTAASEGVASRLTWVGSFVQANHSLAKAPISPGGSVLAHFDDKARFIPMSRYPDSKLLGDMFVAQPAGHTDTRKVIVNSVSPGMVHAGFGDYSLWMRVMFSVVSVAEQLLATSEELGKRD